MSEWEPATEAEVAMREALRVNDQEQYFRVLARCQIVLPVAAGMVGVSGEAGWGTWTTDGRTHVLGFTSAQALTACLSEHAGAYRTVPFAELANTWPNVDWWLAVNPGLPIEGYLPSWFVTQISRGDVRLPGRTLGARARMEHASTVRARARVPLRTVPNQPAAAPPLNQPPLAPIDRVRRDLPQRQAQAAARTAEPAPPVVPPLTSTDPAPIGSTDAPPPTPAGASTPMSDGRPAGRGIDEPPRGPDDPRSWPRREPGRSFAEAFGPPPDTSPSPSPSARVRTPTPPPPRIMPPAAPPAPPAVAQPMQAAAPQAPPAAPVPPSAPSPPPAPIPPSVTSPGAVQPNPPAVQPVVPPVAQPAPPASQPAPAAVQPPPPTTLAPAPLAAVAPTQPVAVPFVPPVVAQPASPAPGAVEADSSSTMRLSTPTSGWLSEPLPRRRPERQAVDAPPATTLPPRESIASAAPMGSAPMPAAAPMVAPEAPPAIGTPAPPPMAPTSPAPPVVAAASTVAERAPTPAAQAPAPSAQSSTPTAQAPTPTVQAPTRTAQASMAAAPPETMTAEPPTPPLGAFGPSRPAAAVDSATGAATDPAMGRARDPEDDFRAAAPAERRFDRQIERRVDRQIEPEIEPQTEPRIEAPAPESRAQSRVEPAIGPDPVLPPRDDPPIVDEAPPSADAVDEPTLTQTPPALAFPDFTPANAVEQELLEAAQTNSTDRFLTALLLAKVLVPGWSGESEIKPADWRTEPILDIAHLVVFTSTDRMAERLGPEVEGGWLKFTTLIRAWPGKGLGFAVNPDSPIGATLPGDEVVQLANWAAEFGLGVEPDPEPVVEQRTPEPVVRHAFEPSQSSEPVMMQKPISPEQLSYYLDRGYDRVSGFVHRAAEVSHLRTPAALFEALGLGYVGSQFKPDADEAFVLRWRAYRENLYRVPFGGQHETAMRAMEGWVIERAPFRGNGFAPSETNDVIAEFKVDSARLPHNAQLWRIDRDGNEQVIAMLDADGPLWRRVGES